MDQKASGLNPEEVTVAGRRHERWFVVAKTNPTKAVF
jgi:hypothetical protein